MTDRADSLEESVDGINGDLNGHFALMFIHKSDSSAKFLRYEASITVRFRTPRPESERKNEH